MGLRTGPLGRGVRVLGAVLLGAGLYILLDLGISGFHDLPEQPSPAGPLILTAVVAVLITDLVSRFLPVPPRARWALLGALGAAVVVAAVVSSVRGSLWGSPLSDLVYVVDVGFLVYACASLLLAAVLGTPGCENLAWVELAARLRGAPKRVSGVWCIGGLHVVDNWELARAARRQRGT
jgi:hypothetical protein